MKWFEILKNIQISSQSGKTKEIKLPPKEDDEDCVGKFYAVQQKLIALQIDGMNKEDTEYNQNFFYAEEKTPPYITFDELDMQTSWKPDPFGNVPNEVFCSAIELYENTSDDETNIDLGKFRIYVAKGKKGTSISNFRDNYDVFTHEILIATTDSGYRDYEVVAEIVIRYRKYYAENLEDGYRDEELANKLDSIVKGLMVF